MVSQQKQSPAQESTRLEDFDPLTFEQERYNIFQQTESTPVPSSTFLDGRWDGALGEEPTADQWLNQPGYREGYLEGVASRLDEKFGLVA